MKVRGAIWNRSHPDHRRFALLASLYYLTRRLAAQKLMYNLIFGDSYFNPTLFARQPIKPSDWLRGTHPRMRWALVARRLDYRPRLEEVSAPALLLVGRHDSQMPPLLLRKAGARTPRRPACGVRGEWALPVHRAGARVLGGRGRIPERVQFGYGEGAWGITVMPENRARGGLL
jgi:pimeloyl-ACP methyl ester carboxylesterase